MEKIKAARVILLLAAFILCGYQMINAVNKFQRHETGQTYITKTIDEIPLPLMLLCKRDQYDWNAARGSYVWRSRLYTGWLGNNTSWGGNKNQTFIEVLKTIYKHKYGMMIFRRKTSRNGDFVTFLQTKNHSTTFVYPHGFCISLENNSNLKPGEELIIQINYKSSLSFDIFITDPSRRVYYSISEASFMGDRIGYAVNRAAGNRDLYYHLDVEERVLNKDNPGEDCTDYGSESHPGSYADCFDADHQAEFFPLLGCMPPWMSKNRQCEGNIPNKPNNYFVNTTMDTLLYCGLTGLEYSFDARKVPCHQMKITSRFLKELVASDRPTLTFNFDRRVEKHYNIQNYDAFDFIVEVGSALGLWLGLCVASIFDLILDSRKLFKYICKALWSP
jgi:hypothetical protein